MSIIVTGGAGFIGSNFVLEWMRHQDETLINVDKLTYAGNLENLSSVEGNGRHRFILADVGDNPLMTRIFAHDKPRGIIHFAAETHVDRSIHKPEDFVQTNIVGTFHLLESAREYWSQLSRKDRNQFRFLHVSSDEVYGSLDPDEPAFTEDRRYEPNSPYSASKAAADHLVRAYYHTYGLPVLTTNCSNNYGPFQFPEKLMPLVICNAVSGKPLPIYGDGHNLRDWLYVEDHCRAIRRVLEAGQVGHTYNIGGGSQLSNLEVVQTLCRILDEFVPRNDGKSYREQITFVKDRPGHDRRYAVDASKIQRELGWMPSESFESGTRKTVRWYLDNRKWVENIMSGAYRHSIEKQYHA